MQTELKSAMSWLNMVRVVTDKQGLMELMKHLMKREGIKNKLTVKKSGGLYNNTEQGQTCVFWPSSFIFTQLAF